MSSDKRANARREAKFAAKRTLSRFGIALGQDFHTLTSDQVRALNWEATRVKYREPKNASGSRARYFHARLQRQAAYRLK